MFVCGFWTLNFFLQYAYSHKSKRILFWFMLTATILYFAHFVVFNHLHNLIPITDTLYTFATLSVYPIFFLYIISLTDRLKPYYYFILLPGGIIALMVGLCYAIIPEELMKEYLMACHYESCPLPNHDYCNWGLWSHKIMKPIIVLEIIPILFSGFKKLAEFKIKVEQFYSNTEHKDLNEVKVLLILFVITSCLSVTADLIGRAYFVGTVLLVALPTVSFGIMLFAIGHYGNIQRFTIDDLEKEMSICEASETPESEVAKQESTHSETTEGEIITGKACNQETETDFRYTLKEKIDKVMAEEELFLKPDLKLSHLAAHLNTNRTYIYEALKLESISNQPLSFPDYVNKFRIAYALKLLKERNYESIESVIYESGFISKTTFYKNFKKFTGETPSMYLQRLKREMK